MNLTSIHSALRHAALRIAALRPVFYHFRELGVMKISDIARRCATRRYATHRTATSSFCNQIQIKGESKCNIT